MKLSQKPWLRTKLSTSHKLPAFWLENIKAPHKSKSLWKQNKNKKEKKNPKYFLKIYEDIDYIGLLITWKEKKPGFHEKKKKKKMRCLKIFELIFCYFYEIYLFKENFPNAPFSNNERNSECLLEST